MFYTAYILVNTGDDPDRPRPGRNWLRNRYRVHQRLWMAFPNVPKAADEKSNRPFLFRLHPFAAFDAKVTPVIEVRSATQPDWQRAFENAPFLVRSTLDELTARQEKPPLDTGAEFCFSLLANPSKKVHPDARKNGTRLGLRLDEELEAAANLIREKNIHPPEELEIQAQLFLARRGEVSEWIARKAERHGFELLHPPISTRESRINPSKLWKEKSPTSDAANERQSEDRYCHMRLDGIQFTGMLRVTNSDVFRNTLLQGIGSGKAFGFGLLSLAPAERGG